MGEKLTMWTDSKKWKEMCAHGGHGVVRFDVFCGHCRKQLGEDVDADGIDKCGLRTDKPLEVFCGYKCAEAYQTATGKRLWSYGWRPTLAWCLTTQAQRRRPRNGPFETETRCRRSLKRMVGRHGRN